MKRFTGLRGLTAVQGPTGGSHLRANLPRECARVGVIVVRGVVEVLHPRVLRRHLRQGGGREGQHASERLQGSGPTGKRCGRHAPGSASCQAPPWRYGCAETWAPPQCPPWRQRVALQQRGGGEGGAALLPSLLSASASLPTVMYGRREGRVPALSSSINADTEALVPLHFQLPPTMNRLRGGGEQGSDRVATSLVCAARVSDARAHAQARSDGIKRNAPIPLAEHLQRASRRRPPSGVAGLYRAQGGCAEGHAQGGGGSSRSHQSKRRKCRPLAGGCTVRSQRGLHARHPVSTRRTPCGCR
jgi:hypothetical protein